MVGILSVILLDFVMVGTRPAPRVVEEGGPAMPGVKGKVYLHEEEEQLCQSATRLLAIN